VSDRGKPVDTASPRVTVLMSLYNEERHVAAAVDSVLAQTYENFEFLIIDDGSTDRSKEIVLAVDDPRIRLISRPNKGLTESLNEGLQLARGEYVARQDADDISLPTRIEKEVAFLDSAPEVGLVGTNYTIIGDDGEPLTTTSVFLHPFDLAVAEIVSNQFGHGSVMMRRSVALELGGYDSTVGDIVSDYDLWLRIGRTARLANLAEPLYRWRRSSRSLSMSDRDLAIKQSFALRDREFQRLLERPVGARFALSSHGRGFFPSRREYRLKRAALFRSLAFLYRANSRPWRAVGMQAAAVLHNPVERRNILYLLLLIRDRSAAPIWEFEFV
jgi:glycosyltransferase involved in cell wall biosynthesis